MQTVRVEESFLNQIKLLFAKLQFKKFLKPNLNLFFLTNISDIKRRRVQTKA